MHIDVKQCWGYIDPCRTLQVRACSANLSPPTPSGTDPGGLRRTSSSWYLSYSGRLGSWPGLTGLLCQRQLTDPKGAPSSLHQSITRNHKAELPELSQSWTTGRSQTGRGLGQTYCPRKSWSCSATVDWAATITNDDCYVMVFLGWLIACFIRSR